MWAQIRMAAIAAAFVAGTATVAYAQGSTTQDPGTMAPGNLTTDRLGPSTGSPATGMPPNAGRNPAATTGPSTGTTIFHGALRGSGSSNQAGPGQLATPPSRAGNP